MSWETINTNATGAGDIVPNLEKLCKMANALRKERAEGVTDIVCSAEAWGVLKSLPKFDLDGGWRYAGAFYGLPVFAFHDGFDAAEQFVSLVKQGRRPFLLTQPAAVQLVAQLRQEGS